MTKRTAKRQYNFTEEGKAFGRRVRELRKAKGLTYEELAVEVGVDLSTIYRIETSKLVITLDLVFALATALGVAPKDMLDFSNLADND